MQLKYATDWTKTVEIWPKKKVLERCLQIRILIQAHRVGRKQGSWRDADLSLIVHHGVGQTKEVRNMFSI